MLTSENQVLRSVLSDSLSTAWFTVTVEMAKFAESYDRLAVRLQSFLGYVDLNIAGFRKVSKQFYKQMPKYVRKCPSMFILVGRRMRAFPNYVVINVFLSMFQGYAMRLMI